MRWVKLVQNHDMRMRHELRRSLAAHRLRPGQCLMAFNRRKTIARIIDSAGGVLDYYAPKGEKLDVQRIAAMVREGFGVELTGRGLRLYRQAS